MLPARDVIQPLERALCRSAGLIVIAMPDKDLEFPRAAAGEFPAAPRLTIRQAA